MMPMMGALTTLLPIAWRNLWRNPRRTVLMMLAVAVGVWSIIAFNSLMRAWLDSSLTSSLRELTGEAQIHAAGYLDDPEITRLMPPPSPALRALLDSREVKLWAPRIRVPGVVRSERDSLPVTLVGIDAAREQGLSFIADPLAQGRRLASADDDGIVVGRKLLQRLKTGLGKRVVVMSQDTQGHLAERGFRIVGVFAAAEQSESAYAFVGLHTAQMLLGADDRLSEVALNVRDAQSLPAVVKQLREAAPALDVQPWQQLKPLTLAMSQLSGSFVGMWLFIMSVLIAFAIVNTLLMAVYERTREFGLLQALGLRPRLIVLQVLLESALLIAIGSLAGALGAVVTIAAFHNGLDLGFLARGAEWLGVGHVLYPRLDFRTLLNATLLVWTLGVVASLWPAWRAARYSPVESMGKT